MGWSYAFWRGGFYPQDLPAKQYLAEYSKHFNTVEVDNTFYRIPSPDTILNWKNQTPPVFEFAAKFPRIITHIKKLENCEQQTAAFLRAVSALGDKSGPLLLQFPKEFGVEHAESLSSFLLALPKRHRYAVEIRNKNWLGEKLYRILRDNSVALALVDQPFMSKVDIVIGNFVYVRWEGDRTKVDGELGKVQVDRTGDIEAWAKKISSFLSTGMDVFGYFSKYYSGHPPTDAEKLRSLLAA